MAKVSLFLLCFMFVLVASSTSAQLYKTLYAPITKDLSTSLFTLTLNQNQKFVVDINSPLSWQLCNRREPPILCSSPECYYGRKYSTRSCLNTINVQKNQYCTCMVTPVNPITRACALSQLTEKRFSIPSANPKNRVLSLNRVYVSCAPVSLFKSLPKGVFGLAGLSWAPLAFSTQFTPLNLGLSKKFALCLPPNGSPKGVAFFGTGPYNLPYDVSKVLSYTPLIRKKSSSEFFIGLAGVAINGKESEFKDDTFEYDNKGNAIAMLSTSVAYTTLRSDVYKVFLNDFAKATRGIPRAKIVYPFGICLKTSAIGWGKAGLKVPKIDMEFGNGKNWTLYGSNSMKSVGYDISCLAIVDGGKTVKQAIVIGSYQMENTLLEFDLTKSKLGVSSALGMVGASCSNFKANL